ncbi:hypothetical protein LCGC14_2272210 [marine sediment metagenome]|uniref:Uncharacterized protein n=1 Tax=marine sediment metagenome TaxID=412755 RepID=A0A0F9DIZ7_9ZZZZ
MMGSDGDYSTLLALAEQSSQDLKANSETLIRLDERSQRTEKDITHIKDRLDQGTEKLASHKAKIAVLEDRTRNIRKDGVISGAASGGIVSAIVQGLMRIIGG